MEMFSRCLLADFQKTKRLSIWSAHILIPVCIAGVFLAYYSFAQWNAYSKVEAYFQVLGIGFPFLIGLFCVMLSEQELSAGGFQVMLSSPKRLPAFLSKLTLLILTGTFAVFLASVLFGAGYSFLLRQSIVGVSFYWKASFAFLGSSILLYVWHLFLALRFNKGVSIGIGITESLISALFLTGMGDGLWSYVPCAWSSRFVTYILAMENGSELMKTDFNIAICICILTTISSIILFCVWSCRWEGQNTSD
jgi:ABC-2 type transport system permease protein